MFYFSKPGGLKAMLIDFTFSLPTHNIIVAINFIIAAVHCIESRVDRHNGSHFLNHSKTQYIHVYINAFYN